MKTQECRLRAEVHAPSKPKRPRALHALFVLGHLAPLVYVGGCYVNYVVQIPHVVVAEQRGARANGYWADLPALRAGFDEVVSRLLAVFVPLSFLWCGVVVLVYFARRWARVVVTVMAGLWMAAMVLLMVWSIGRGGVPGLALMLRPEARGYEASDGAILYATVHCGLTVGLLIGVIVMSFLGTTNNHMLAKVASRRERRAARKVVR